MEYLKPNDRRANLAIIGIVAVTIVALLSLISSYFQYRLIKMIQVGDIYTEDQLNSNDVREKLISILYLLAYVFSVIAFIRWFRRAYYNLEQKTNFLSFTNATAAWAWFVPIFNIYKPYQMMKEMFTKTEVLLENNQVQPNRSLKTGILGLWWALWIIHEILGRIDFQLTRHLVELDDFLYSSIFSIITNISMIPLSIVTILFIKNYAANESRLAIIPNIEDEISNTSTIAEEESVWMEPTQTID